MRWFGQGEDLSELSSLSWVQRRLHRHIYASLLRLARNAEASLFEDSAPRTTEERRQTARRADGVASWAITMGVELSRLHALPEETAQRDSKWLSDLRQRAHRIARGGDDDGLSGSREQGGLAGDGPGTDFWARKSEAVAAAVRDAIATVEVGGRGRPIDEVEAALVRELRVRGGYMSPAEIRVMAISISDPSWLADHPGEFEALLPSNMDELPPLSPDDESGALERLERELDRQSDRLGDVLERCRGVRDFNVLSERTVDGWIFRVGIDSWSLRLAGKVRRKAAPLSVEVMPLERLWVLPDPTNEPGS